MKTRIAIIFLSFSLFFAGSLAAVTPGVSATRIDEINILTTTESYDPILYEAGHLIAQSWRELGFEVSVRTRDLMPHIQIFYDEQDFDVAILLWTGRVDRLDPHFFLSTLSSEQTGLGENNPGGYVNLDYDTILEKQQKEFDVNARRELVHEAQRIIVEDQPLHVLYYRDQAMVFNHETFANYEVMAGEGLYNDWTPHSVTPLTENKVLRIGTPSEPDTLNPLDSTTASGWKLLRIVYDRLVRLTPDVEPQPWAAEEIVAVDETTVDVTIRPNMTFHDGVPLTVEDVKFAYEYYIEQDFAYFRSFFQVIDSIEITGERTVRFNLKEPFSPFITVTLSQIPILPKHIWSDIDNPQDLAPDQIPTVGSGPFSIERYDRGEFIELATFKDHFSAEDTEIEGIEFTFYADVEGLFTGLVLGEVDMPGRHIEPAHMRLARDEDHLTIITVPDFGYHKLRYNLRREPFNDVSLRRALAYAIDKTTITNVLLDGLGEPGSSIIAPINTFWHNSNVQKFDYDLDRARELLAEAGYWWDAQGRINYPEN